MKWWMLTKFIMVIVLQYMHISKHAVGEGNGSPLQCSCLENPRDREAWWAPVYGVTQSRARLKWLSIASMLYTWNEVIRQLYLGLKASIVQHSVFFMVQLLNCGIGQESPMDSREIEPINPEGNQPRVFIQYSGHLVWRADSLEKTPMLGKMAGEGRRGWQRMRWLGGITDWWTGAWASSGSWWRTEEPGVLKPMGLQRVGYDLAAEL